MLKEPFKSPGEEAYKHGLLQECLWCVMGWQVVPVIKLLPQLQTNSPVLDLATLAPSSADHILALPAAPY